MTLTREGWIKGFDPHTDYTIRGIDILQILMNCKGIKNPWIIKDKYIEPSELAEGIEGILAKLIKQDDQEALR